VGGVTFGPFLDMWVVEVFDVKIPHMAGRVSVWGSVTVGVSLLCGFLIFENPTFFVSLCLVLGG